MSSERRERECICSVNERKRGKASRWMLFFSSQSQVINKRSSSRNEVGIRRNPQLDCSSPSKCGSAVRRELRSDLEKGMQESGV
jgi:hypothetical protein